MAKSRFLQINMLPETPRQRKAREHRLADMGRRVWHKKPLSIFLLYVFGAWLCLWNLHIPDVGYAVGVLAVAAAVMSFMGEMGGAEKIAWLLVLFGFLFVEIFAIKTSNQAHLSELRAAQYEQAEHFEKIGKDIKGSVEKSDKHFGETLDKENDVLDDIVGGKTFCVVEVLPFSSKFELAAMAVGPNPLRNVLVDEIDSDMKAHMFGTPEWSFDTIQTMTAHYTIPFVTSLSAYLMGSIPMKSGDTRSFALNFFSTNGTWREELLLRRLSSGAWLQAFKVSKDVPVKNHNSREIVLCKSVPDNFPITPSDEDWLKQRSECRAK
jgi:hypothetical protein